MHSVRLRITLIAALATAVAVSLIAMFLLSRVEQSLRDEIDLSVTNQVLSYQNAISTFDDIVIARYPDPQTLFVAFDADGTVYDANVEMNLFEVVASVDVTPDAFGEVVLFDLALSNPTEIEGSESMRGAWAELIFLEDIDEPVYGMFARVTGSVDRTVSGMRNALLVAVPLVVAFVAALAWWLTGRSLRPVDRMRREVDEITSSDLGRRVSEPPATDEIGELATTMNQMLSRLEQAKRSQDQFVSDAAHELRTPLASIAAQLDVDETHPASADRVATARNVRGEVTRLQTLIDGLLASARNADTPSAVPTALVDLDVIASESAQRVTRPGHIALDRTNVGIGTVRGDQQALARLVDNLLANAYRHATSTAVLSAGTDASGVWLTVDDDGAGIAAVDRERVFERFVRLDEARSRDSGGSGLGLALAWETAVQHGGTLRCVASTLGGARFELRLPAG